MTQCVIVPCCADSEDLRAVFLFLLTACADLQAGFQILPSLQTILLSADVCFACVLRCQKPGELLPVAGFCVTAPDPEDAAAVLSDFQDVHQGNSFDLFDLLIRCALSAVFSAVPTHLQRPAEERYFL